MIPDDLIARLEAAREGSQELDLDIALAVDQRIWGGNPMWASVRQGVAQVGRGPFLSDSLNYVWMIRRFTRSLDAALTLVPEGWRLSTLGQDKRGPWGCVLVDSAERPCMIGVSGATATVALCIAALKAGQAIEREQKEV